MNKIREMSPKNFLRLLFAFFTLAFLAAAVLMPDRAYMFSGLKNIICLPAKIPTNYFSPGYGGYAGAFLNAGLVGLIATGLFFLPKAKVNGASVIAFLLTVGFCFWGINVLNVWFGFFGVVLYCLVKKEPLGDHANTMLFTTALAPLISDLLFYYPNEMYIGFRWQGFVLALAVGLFLGFFLPAGLAHSANLHKGFDIYSAAVPMGMMAFLLRAVLYGVFAAPRGTTEVGPIANEFVSLKFASWPIANVFCFVVFGLCIVGAFVLGCKPKDYWNLMKDSGHQVDFSQKYGIAATLMNVGVFGLFIVLYYNIAAWVGGSETVFNGVTFGCIFCMLATCCSGSHPRNVWPILLGYILASLAGRWVCESFLHIDNVVYKQAIDAQAILIGACFANGLSPVAGKYGWLAGVVAGIMHFCLVTSVPMVHGGFCLYNGGFTAAFTCVLLVPVLERFFRTKEERRASKAASVNN